MRRREFLIATAAIAAASAVPALAALRSAGFGHGHRLLRLDPDSERYMSDTASALAAAPGQGPLRVHFERLIPARYGGLESLEVTALFDNGDEAPWRHIAWRYRRGDRFGSSRGNSFVAMPGMLRALQFDYRDGAHALHLEHCPCDGNGGLPLVPGRYLLAFAGRDPQVNTSLPFSGDRRAALPDTARFDCLSVRIEAETPGPDLSLRADLACVATAPGACATA